MANYSPNGEKRLTSGWWTNKTSDQLPANSLHRLQQLFCTPLYKTFNSITNRPSSMKIGKWNLLKSSHFLRTLQVDLMIFLLLVKSKKFSNRRSISQAPGANPLILSCDLTQSISKKVSKRKVHFSLSPPRPMRHLWSGAAITGQVWTPTQYL